MNLENYSTINQKQAQLEINSLTLSTFEIARKVSTGDLDLAEFHLENLKRSFRELKRLQEFKRQNDQLDFYKGQIKGHQQMHQIWEHMTNESR
jgi:hypothetical protein